MLKMKSSFGYTQKVLIKIIASLFIERKMTGCSAWCRFRRLFLLLLLHIAVFISCVFSFAFGTFVVFVFRLGETSRIRTRRDGIFFYFGKLEQSFFHSSHSAPCRLVFSWYINTKHAYSKKKKSIEKKRESKRKEKGQKKKYRLVDGKLAIFSSKFEFAKCLFPLWDSRRLTCLICIGFERAGNINLRNYLNSRRERQHISPCAFHNTHTHTHTHSHTHTHFFCHFVYQIDY